MGSCRFGTASADTVGVRHLFVGTDSIGEGEAETIRVKGLEVIDLATVQGDCDTATTRASEWASRFERVLVHCDVDVLAFTDFPIAENARRQAGLTFEQLSASLAKLLAFELARVDDHPGQSEPCTGRGRDLRAPQ